MLILILVLLVIVAAGCVIYDIVFFIGAYDQWYIYVVLMVLMVIALFIPVKILERKKLSLKMSKKENLIYRDLQYTEKQEYNQQLNEYSVKMSEYHKQYENKMAKNKAKYGPQIEVAKVRYNEAKNNVERCTLELRKDDTLPEKEKRLEVVDWLIDRIKNKRASDIVQALNQYDDYLRSRALVEIERIDKRYRDEMALERMRQESAFKNRLAEEAKKQTDILKEINNKLEQ